jgi:hypothetical protein
MASVPDDTAWPPVAQDGPLAAGIVFPPARHWAGGPCPTLQNYVDKDVGAQGAGHFRLPPNPSRPCDGVLVSGLPATGSSFLHTVQALDVGLVVTCLLTPLTTAGPAWAPAGVPTVPPADLLAVSPEAVNPGADEVAAVRYAANLRNSMGTPVMGTDVLQREDPEAFAAALRCAALCHGVVFLHVPTPDGLPLHTGFMEALVGAAQAAWDGRRRVWVHCWAGMYRSYLTALAIMQRCVWPGRGVPMLDPQVVHMEETVAARDGAGTGRPLTHHWLGVRVHQLAAFQDAATPGCRCSVELHFLWLVLSHAKRNAVCLAEESGMRPEEAASWVAARDKDAAVRLWAGYNLEGMGADPGHGAPWAAVRAAVAHATTHLPAWLVLAGVCDHVDPAAVLGAHGHRATHVHAVPPGGAGVPGDAVVGPGTKLHVAVHTVASLEVHDVAPVFGGADTVVMLSGGPAMLRSRLGQLMSLAHPVT